MKTKILGLVALMIAFTLMVAQRAVADGTHDGQDSDFSGPKLSADFSNSTAHTQFSADDQDRDDLDQNHPTFDHILARDFSPTRDCGCDNPPDPSASAPEPSSLVLMAVGLTPFLWIRRRIGR